MPSWASAPSIRSRGWSNAARSSQHMPRYGASWLAPGPNTSYGCPCTAVADTLALQTFEGERMLRGMIPLVLTMAAVVAGPAGGAPPDVRKCAHRVIETTRANGQLRKEGPCRTGEYVSFDFYTMGHWTPKRTVTFDEGPETRTVWCGSEPVASAPADDHDTLAAAWEKCTSEKTPAPPSWNTGRLTLTCETTDGFKIVRAWIEIRAYYESGRLKEDQWRSVKHGTHSCSIPLHADYRRIPEFPKVWIETSLEAHG